MRLGDRISDRAVTILALIVLALALVLASSIESFVGFLALGFGGAWLLWNVYELAVEVVKALRRR